MADYTYVELIVASIARISISLAIVITGCIMVSHGSNEALWAGFLGTVLGLWFPNTTSSIATAIQGHVPAVAPLVAPPAAPEVVIPPPPEPEAHVE